jgi:hypothetical protein
MMEAYGHHHTAGASGQELVATAQKLATAYAEARVALPQLPAEYQSARPWFVFLGRAVAQHETAHAAHS